MLGDISLRCTPLDCALLLASDGSGFLQIICHVRDAARELAVIGRAVSTGCNKVRDRAAVLERGIGDPRITGINDNGGPEVRIRTLIYSYLAQDANGPKLLCGRGDHSRRRVQNTHIN